MEPQFELGEVLRSSIDGFEGLCTGISTYLTSCNRYQLRPITLNADKTQRVAVWFDEGELERVFGGTKHRSARVGFGVYRR